MEKAEFYKSPKGKFLAVYRGYKYYFASKSRVRSTSRWVCCVKYCYASISTADTDTYYRIVRFAEHKCTKNSLMLAKTLKKYTKRLEPPYSFISRLGSNVSSSFSEIENKTPFQKLLENAGTVSGTFIYHCSMSLVFFLM